MTKYGFPPAPQLIPFKEPTKASSRRDMFAKRHDDWLPIPKDCPLCGCCVVLLRNRVLYKKDVGNWPFLYWCLGCGAAASTHPYSIYPKGILASAETRAARNRVHALLDPLWKEGEMTRPEAYALLTLLMGRAPDDQVHIGHMGDEELELAEDVLMTHWITLEGNKAFEAMLGFTDDIEEFPTNAT